MDAETGKVVSVTAADLDVARIDGAWLITTDRRNKPSWKSEILPKEREPRVAAERRRRIDDPLVRAVARTAGRGYARRC